jgi:hypothetical protein
MGDRLLYSPVYARVEPENHTTLVTVGQILLVSFPVYCSNYQFSDRSDGDVGIL